MEIMRMTGKFRFYCLLICTSGLVLLLLYKALNSDDDVEKFEGKPVSSKPALPYKTKLKPLFNINDLMTITQPPDHVAKQQLRESDINSKVRQGARQPSGPTLSSFFTPLPERIVHLDLKGAPPKISYYTRLFKLLHSLGATGVLIEYEDMFPYAGWIADLAASNAYTRSDITQLVKAANDYHLEVIPLVQTFGHLEFALKQAKYQGLREVQEYPQVICPTMNESWILVKEMLNQVIQLHPNVRRIHIGSDEVYHIGMCSRCMKRMDEKHLDKDDLFLLHVLDVAVYVTEKHNIQVLMWDDMFRHMPLENIKKSNVWKYVDIVAWQYSPTVEEKLSPDIWEKYGSIFTGIWAASAFKGATGPSKYLVDTKYYVENHSSWLKIINDFKNKIQFRGIILTGWQRYDHFAVLCELLPAAIPCLSINLLYLQYGRLDPWVMNKVREIIQCDDSLSIASNFSSDEVVCHFPGSKVYKVAQRLAQLKIQVEKLFNTSHLQGWITEYNAKMGFSSPYIVQEGVEKLAETLTTATLLHTYIQNTMLEIFDTYTVEEWTLLNIDPILAQLRNLQQRVQKLLSYKTWPRRPLSPRV